MSDIHTGSQEALLPRAEQKQHALEGLDQDHAAAIAAYEAQKEAREARRAEAFGIHVTCMDERDTFAGEATGEPLGALELFATPGGRTTPDELLKAYGSQLEAARKAGKELTIWLMPHHCAADSHAGCAAFAADEAAQTEYFTKLSDDLRSRPEFDGVNILTAFYDTDAHALKPFHGTELPERAVHAAGPLAGQTGVSSAEGKAELDRSHAGTRVYVGDRPRAWVARRNVTYHLSPEMESDALLEGIALAVKVMKTHAHADLSRTPIVIQIDRHPGTEDVIGMADADLLERLNVSPLLKGIELTPDEMLVVRTETDPATWQGQRLEGEEIAEAA